MALFSDDNLYQEILSKATFWLQQNFYGVNLTSLHTEALNQYFTQVHQSPSVLQYDLRRMTGCGGRVRSFATGFQHEHARHGFRFHC